MAMTTWLTLHRVRLGEMRDGAGRPLPGPALARHWRFYPDSAFEPGVGPTLRSDIWGGFAMYDSREDAETVLADPAAHIPCLADAAESWHGLALPVAHRGAVNWRGAVEHDGAVTPAPTDPGGALCVLTSAGYDPATRAGDGRVPVFFDQVASARSFYEGAAGNLAVAVYAGGAVDGHDGLTMTLWRDDASMLAAAYRSGTHRDHLARHKATPIFDRSSFTRARVLVSRGSWDGRDPLAAQ